MKILFLGISILALLLSAAQGLRSQTAPILKPLPQAADLLRSHLEKEEPILIKADEMSYNGKKKLNSWLGHVVLRRGSTVLHADKINAVADRNSAAAQGHVHLTDDKQGIDLKSGFLEYHNQLKDVVATGNPVLIVADKQKGVPTVIKGDKMEIFNVEKRALVSGNVIITDHDIVATAEQAQYFDTEQKIVLTGKPHIKKGENNFNGNMITAYLKENHLIMEGNVQAKIFPEQFSKKNN